jgi:hypothetical protein
MRQSLLQPFIRSPVSFLMVSLLLTQIALCLISRLMNHRMPLVSDVVMPCLLSLQTSAVAEHYVPGQTQCCHLQTNQALSSAPAAEEMVCCPERPTATRKVPMQHCFATSALIEDVHVPPSLLHH